MVLLGVSDEWCIVGVTTDLSGESFMYSKDTGDVSNVEEDDMEGIVHVIICHRLGILDNVV